MSIKTYCRSFGSKGDKEILMIYAEWSARVEWVIGHWYPKTPYLVWINQRMIHRLTKIQFLVEDKDVHGASHRVSVSHGTSCYWDIQNGLK